MMSTTGVRTHDAEPSGLGTDASRCSPVAWDLSAVSEAVILALVLLVPVVLYTGTANANLIKVTIFGFGMLLISGIWLVSSASDRKISWLESPLHLPVVCHLLWNLITACVSDGSSRSAGGRAG